MATPPLEGELIPRDSTGGGAGASQGEWLGRRSTAEEKAEALADLEMPHAKETATRPFVGALPNPADLNPDWVIARLMREACDHGTRSRQSGRVAALKLLGEYLDLGKVANPESEGDVMRKAMAALPPEQRQAKIAQLFARLKQAGISFPEDVPADGG